MKILPERLWHQQFSGSKFTFIWFQYLLTEYRFVMNFSILTALAPSLYHFLNELASGPGFGGIIDRSQYELSSYSGGRSESKKKRSSTYLKMSDTNKPTFRPDIQEGNGFGTTVSSERRESGPTTTSNDQDSEDMIIRQTTNWSIRTYDEQ